MIAALLDGQLARAEPGARAVCPECREAVYARVPEHAIRHWAHLPLPGDKQRDCAADAGEMSEWHREWQWLRTDLERVEVRGDGHRADAINNGGFAIEFQHSTIALEQIEARERYWRKGVWVLDGTPVDGEDRVDLRRKPDQAAADPWRLFVWKRAPLLLYRAKWPCWIDLGDRGLLQVRVATQGRGNGWLVDKAWFVDEVLNGIRPTLRPHTTGLALPRQRQPRQVRRESSADLEALPTKCNRAVSTEPCCRGGLLELHCQLCPTSPTYWRSSEGLAASAPTIRGASS